MKFPTYKEMGEKVAKEAMDTFEYNGKTLREWIEIIASNDGDTISRKAAIALADSLKDDLPDDERLADCVMAHNEGILDYQTALSLLPPADPKTGKWKNIIDGIEYTWGTCDTCGAHIPMPYKYYEYCPHCGMKNEVKHG